MADRAAYLVVEMEQVAQGSLVIVQEFMGVAIHR